MVMHFGHVFPEVLPAFELSWTVATLEVPFVCVNHHVVLELVLVSQLLSANVTRVDGGVDVHRFHVVFEGLVGAVRLSAIALERLLPSVHVLVHLPVLVVEKGFATYGATVLPGLALVLVVTLDVGQQVLFQEELFVADGTAVL